MELLEETMIIVKQSHRLIIDYIRSSLKLGTVCSFISCFKSCLKIVLVFFSAKKVKFIVANRANSGLCVLQAQSLTAYFILSLCAPWKWSNNNTSDLKHWRKLNTQPF